MNEPIRCQWLDDAVLHRLSASMGGLNRQGGQAEIDISIEGSHHLYFTRMFMFSPSNLTDQNSDPQTPIPAASLDWSSKESISARASIVGERLALKSLESIQPLATNPLIISAGANGCAVLLRYGVVVTFNLSTIEESKLLTTLKPHIRDPLNGTASEVLAIAFRSNGNVSITAGKSGGCQKSKNLV